MLVYNQARVLLLASNLKKEHPLLKYEILNQKNEYYPDQKRCIPLVKVYLRDYLVMGIVTMNLLKKTFLPVMLKNNYKYLNS